MNAPPQNPFDPIGWSGRIDVSDPVTIILPASTPIPVVDQDPWRLWFQVAPANAADTVRLWLAAQSDAYGVGSNTSGNAILIHNASYPGAVGRIWYAYSAAAIGSVQVIVARLVP